jgi:hypothetical protein
VRVSYNNCNPTVARKMDPCQLSFDNLRINNLATDRSVGPGSAGILPVSYLTMNLCE